MFGIAPPNTDYFMNTLAMILGPVVKHVTGIGGTDGAADTTTAVSVLLGYVNDIALFVATAWILYIGFVSLLRTAHEGEWMGQKWSTLWIPLRVALAAAFVLPVFPNGAGGNYSAIQAAIVWAEGNAVGMADKAWAMSAQYIVKDPFGGVTMNNQKVTNMAETILVNDVCLDEVNSKLSGAPAFDPNALRFYQKQTTVDAVAQDMETDVINTGGDAADWIWSGNDKHPLSTVYEQDYWGFNTGANGTIEHNVLSFVVNPNICGTITYPVSASNGGTGLGSSVGAAVDNAVYSVASAQMGTLVSGIKPLADQIFTWNKPSRAAFATLIHNYENNVMTQVLPQIAAAEKPATQKFLNDMQKQGFATAGSWWWEITHMNQEAQEAINNIGKTTTVSHSILDASIPLIGGHLLSEKNAYKFINGYNQAHPSGVKGAPASEMPQAADDSIAGLLDAVDQGVIGDASQWLSDEPRNKNPILGLEHVGTIFTGIGGALYGVIIGSKAAGAVAKAGDGVSEIGGAFKSASSLLGAAAKGPIGDLLMLLATAFMGIGIIMTVWIPMLPYIIWTFAIFGLLIFFVEAVFAGPFWAIAHMNPEGHEVVGSGARGWMLMLQLLLKPVLMVAGLIAGTALLYAGAWIVQHTIGGAILDTFTNSAGGFVGPLDGLAQAVIYCIMLIVIIDMSFSMIHKLPDWIMGWIGGGDTSRGEKDMSDKADQHKTAGGGKANEMTGGGMKALTNKE